MDYKKILKVYIRHVGACEGTDFITNTDEFYPELTKEEADELVNLAKATWDEHLAWLEASGLK